MAESKTKNQVKVKNVKKSLKISKKVSDSKTVKKSETKNEVPAKEAKTQVLKKNNLEIEVFDTKGKAIETIKLPEEIFGVKINKQLIAQSIRIYLSNQRRGTASTKSRGEVQGSSRKIYKQKGTGRARHGSIRAPIFVHGGIALGPKPRDFSLNLPKKMKRIALFSTLSSKLKDGQIKVVTGLEKIAPKTKIMDDVLKKIGIDKTKKVLLIIPFETKEKMDNVILAARNIEGINLAKSNNLNTFDLLNNQTLFFMKESLEGLKKVFIGEK